MDRSLRVPCVLMRGGTSRGPFFLEATFRAIRGNENGSSSRRWARPRLQVDGIGGGDPLTSKVAIVGAPTQPGADVDTSSPRSQSSAPPWTSARTGATCSPPSALSRSRPGWCGPGRRNHRQHPQPQHREHCGSGDPDPCGASSTRGDRDRRGAGTAAPVKLTFLDAIGSKTGVFLPTGHAAKSSGTRRSASSTTPCRWCCSARATSAFPATRRPTSSTRT